MPPPQRGWVDALVGAWGNAWGAVPPWGCKPQGSLTLLMGASNAISNLEPFNLLGRSWRQLKRRFWGLLCGLMLSSACTAWDASQMMSAARSRGPDTLAAVQALQSMLKRVAFQGEKDKAQAVNEFFNRQVMFQEDIRTWGVEDYWTTPIELLEKGRGDCEDYAIAKYFTLVALGVSQSQLRLVYVQASIAGAQQAHLVLAFYPNSANDPIILDNLVTSIQPATQRADLTPIFSFNAQGLWQGVGVQSAGDPLTRLSRWRGVLGRVQMEGFQ